MSAQLIDAQAKLAEMKERLLVARTRLQTASRTLSVRELCNLGNEIDQLTNWVEASEATVKDWVAEEAAVMKPGTRYSVDSAHNGFRVMDKMTGEYLDEYGPIEHMAEAWEVVRELEKARSRPRLLPFVQVVIVDADDQM